MGGAEGTGRVIACASLLVLLAAAIAPGISVAAEPSRVAALPGDAHAAQVADVDGDGANELVRILGDRAVGHVVEAWGHDGEDWELRGSTTIPELVPSAGVRQFVPGSDASALLAWRADGRVRMLVLARWGASADDPNAFPCCLTIHELVWRDGEINLEERPLEGGVADHVQALDVDGDGTDELVRVVSNFSGESAVIDVLRWDGEAFRSILREDGAEFFGAILTGDTDGRVGDDLLFGPSPQGVVRRFAWADGTLVEEEAHLDLGPRSEGFVSGIADGALLMTLPHELRIVRWARGEEPLAVARLSATEYPFGGAFGAGADTLLAVQEPFQVPGSIPRLTVYDLELNALGEVAPDPSVERLAAVIGAQMSSGRFIGRYLYPYTGSLPGAEPGTTTGFSWGGVLVEAAAGGGYETRPMSPLVGLQPIGLAGPSDAWMAFSGGYIGGGNVASLYSGMVPPGLGGISLVRFDDLLRAARAVPTIELRDAVVVGEPDDGVTQLAAAADGFEVIVAAPAGSWVAAHHGGAVDELAMTEMPATIEIASSRRRTEDDQAIHASLLVVTPDGHATVVEWEGWFIREPPELTVRGRTDAFALSAMLEGTAGANVTVTVDGRPVLVAADGGFATTVDAAPWPRSVIVAARDPLGNEVVERVEVVGLLDYRGLPWVAIAGAATLAVGAILFVRIPRRRTNQLPGLGDGRLEELDPIDGAGLDSR